jgi:hypothetical protein
VVLVVLHNTPESLTTSERAKQLAIFREVVWHIALNKKIHHGNNHTWLLID